MGIILSGTTPVPSLTELHQCHTPSFSFLSPPALFIYLLPPSLLTGGVETALRLWTAWSTGLLLAARDQRKAPALPQCHQAARGPFAHPGPPDLLLQPHVDPPLHQVRHLLSIYSRHFSTKNSGLRETKVRCSSAKTTCVLLQSNQCQTFTLKLNKGFTALLYNQFT